MRSSVHVSADGMTRSIRPLRLALLLTLALLAGCAPLLSLLCLCVVADGYARIRVRVEDRSGTMHDRCTISLFVLGVPNPGGESEPHYRADLEPADGTEGFVIEPRRREYRAVIQCATSDEVFSIEPLELGGAEFHETPLDLGTLVLDRRH